MSLTIWHSSNRKESQDARKANFQTPADRVFSWKTST